MVVRPFHSQGRVSTAGAISSVSGALHRRWALSDCDNLLVDDVEQAAIGDAEFGDDG